MSPSTMTVTDVSDDMQDMQFHQRGCCLWIPCFGSKASVIKSSSYALGLWERVQAPEKKKKQWWSKGCVKIRKLSKILARKPKWNTFICQFIRKSCIYKKGTFQYDPLSYALNFDDGKGQEDDDDYSYADFSSRYASLPSSTKSSMDLGKDGPSFT